MAQYSNERIELGNIIKKIRDEAITSDILQGDIHEVAQKGAKFFSDVLKCYIHSSAFKEKLHKRLKSMFTALESGAWRGPIGEEIVINPRDVTVNLIEYLGCLADKQPELSILEGIYWVLIRKFEEIPTSYLKIFFNVREYFKTKYEEEKQ